MMKPATRLLLALLICLGLAVLAYFWVTGLMGSLYAYRSPLKDAPPQPGAPISEDGARAARRVVFILVDALRADTAWDAEVMPFVGRLLQQGAWATMHSRPPSYSAPSYTVLFTGAWPDLSDGPALNPAGETIRTWTQDNLFSAAQRSGLNTAIAAFYWFEKLIPQAAVQAGFYTRGEDQQADREVVDAALPWLQSGDYQLVLIHLDQVDYAGHHQGGPRDPRWNEAARRADQLIGEITAHLDLSQDVLLVASDHGQIERGGHGGNEPVVLLEPFVLVGAGVRPGDYGAVNMADVAPTLAALLGTHLPAAAQGRVLSEMISLPAGQTAALPGALEAQQARLAAAYFEAIGQQIPLPAPGEVSGTEIVGAYQAALQQARQARVNRERLPRLLLALAGVSAPLLYLLRRSRRALAWLLGAAAVYALLFNLRYTLLDGRTYSLSSVASADDLILYTAAASGLALLAAWLVYAAGTHFLERDPLQAGLAALDLVFASIWLLSLPVWWSVFLNGALITWTLPEFSSMFLGFLSLVQILMLAVLGMLLAGLSAAAAWLAGSRTARQ